MLQKRKPEIGIVCAEVCESRCRNTDDDGWLSTKTNRLAHDRWIAVKLPLPIAKAEHRNGSRTGGFASRIEQAPSDSGRAQLAEIIRTHKPGLHALLILVEHHGRCVHGGHHR